MGVVFFDSGENVVFICFFCFFLNGRLGKLQGQVPEVTEPRQGKSSEEFARGSVRNSIVKKKRLNQFQWGLSFSIQERM